MKSVLHVIASTDGAQTMLCRLLLGGNRAERAIAVSLPKVGPIGDWLINLGVEVRSLKMRKSITDAAALLHLILLIRGAQPDIVHTCMEELYAGIGIVSLRSLWGEGFVQCAW